MRHIAPALVLLLGATAGCPGIVRQPVQLDRGPAAPDLPAQDRGAPYDQGAPADAPAGGDGGVDRGLDAGAPCTPDDGMTACDPVTPGGCPTGAGCYLVGGEGPDCVCPAGTRARGKGCSTSALCLPGHVCATKGLAATCMRICRPSAPSCPAGTDCLPILGMPQYGICTPAGLPP